MRQFTTSWMGFSPFVFNTEKDVRVLCIFLRNGFMCAANVCDSITQLNSRNAVSTMSLKRCRPCFEISQGVWKNRRHTQSMTCMPYLASMYAMVRRHQRLTGQLNGLELNTSVVHSKRIKAPTYSTSASWAKPPLYQWAFGMQGRDRLVAGS